MRLSTIARAWGIALWLLFPAYLNGQTVTEINAIAAEALHSEEADPKAAFNRLNALSRRPAFAQADTAMTVLGSFHYRGTGTFSDRKAGMRLWRKASALGNTTADFLIVVHYATYSPLSQTQKAEALAAAERAAKDDFSFAQYQYGRCLFFGTWNSPRDRTEGLEWIKSAARAGDAYGCYQLGTFYETGNQVDLDQSTAIELYTTAAEKDHIPSMRKLYTFYRQGTGTRQDYNQALRWLKKACRMNDPEAQYRMGLVYLNGECGVAEDRVQARIQFNRAADQGFARAKSALAEMNAPPAPIGASEPGRRPPQIEESTPPSKRAPLDAYDAAIDAYLEDMAYFDYDLKTHGTVTAGDRFPLKIDPYGSHKLVFIVNEGTTPGYFPRFKVEYFDLSDKRIGMYTTDVSDVVRHHDHLTAVVTRLRIPQGAHRATLTPYNAGYFMSALD
ncbi:MAG: tetratricopeptide repeat protein [Bacteroidota bacterium]